MAKWELQMTGLEVVGYDEYGWPITRLVELTMQVTEDKTIRLPKTAQKQRVEEFPTCCAFRTNSVQRTDKRTTKDYGAWADGIEPLEYELTAKQEDELARMKEEIFRKVIGNSKLRDSTRWLISDEGRVRFITNDLAWLTDQSGILTHHEAEEIMTAIKEFYSRISPEELAVLRLGELYLTHEGLQMVSLYRVSTSTQPN